MLLFLTFLLPKNCLKTEGAPLKTRGKCLKLFAAFFITLFFQRNYDVLKSVFMVFIEQKSKF